MHILQIAYLTVARSDCFQNGNSRVDKAKEVLGIELENPEFEYVPKRNKFDRGAPVVYESRSNDQDHSLTTDLSMLAADLAIGLIGSGQNKKSEEQDLAPNKKRGPRL